MNVINGEKECLRRERPEAPYLIPALITALFLAISLFFMIVILLSVSFISLLLLRMKGEIGGKLGEKL